MGREGGWVERKSDVLSYLGSLLLPSDVDVVGGAGQVNVVFLLAAVVPGTFVRAGV